MSATPRRRLDPDALAALEEERDFLLRSIEDLDAEHAVGDIDDADHAALRDDYTRRAADTIRAIDGSKQAFAAAGADGNRGRQALVWIVGLAVFGGLAGLLVARTSGARSEGEGITGGVNATSTSLLVEAQALLGDQDRWDEAIDLYDEVVDQDPTNAEAVTYGAWLRYRQGEDPLVSLAAWSDARAIDEEYPDSFVFSMIVLSELGRYDEAAALLEVLDLAAAPPEIVAMVQGRGLDAEIYGESRLAALTATAAPQLEALDLDVDSALAAAGYLLASGRDGGAVAAIKLYRAVRAVDPDNAAALTREAMVLASSASVENPDLRDEAIVLLDRAVDANPDDAEARLSRAIVVMGDDRDLGCADLEVLATFDAVPEDFTARADELAAQFCTG